MTPRPTAAPRTGTAIALFSVGIFCFAANDALGKWLVSDYPVGQLMLTRMLGAALFLVPMLMRYPDSRRLPSQVGWHGLRVVILACETFAFYFAVRRLPLADVMTFYLAAPLFVTVLAVLLLGERIGPWRIFALLLGFAGVVIALRPSSQALSPGAVVAFVGSLLFAVSLVITRRLRQAHWLSLITGQFLGSGVIGAALNSTGWVMPAPRDLLLMLFVGIVSMMCFLCINRSLRLAEASVLAPFHYTSIIWGVLFGWLVWGDLPTPAVWTGIALIVTSGVIVWLRERRAGTAHVVEATAT